MQVMRIKMLIRCINHIIAFILNCFSIKLWSLKVSHLLFMVLSLIPAPKEGSFKLLWLENRLGWLARSKIGLFLKALSFGRGLNK